jgi:hypothetical protein
MNELYNGPPPVNFFTVISRKVTIFSVHKKPHTEIHYKHEKAAPVTFNGPGIKIDNSFRHLRFSRR